MDRQTVLNGPHFTTKIRFAVNLYMDEVSLFQRGCRDCSVGLYGGQFDRSQCNI